MNEASEEHPVYAVTRQGGGSTRFYMITVDEGWRSWILCTDMYLWAAEQLLAVLQTSGHRWVAP